MPKTPNLRQAPTGVYKFPPAMKLPKMTVITSPNRNPALRTRINQSTPAAPAIGNPTAPAMTPAPGLTNRLLIPEEAAPQFRDDVAPRNGMMPPPDSEMIAPPITE
jgi:hypothetical protein